MCLGIPMRIVGIDGGNAVCEARGIHREANLLLLPEPASLGDMVVIHMGNAIRRVTEDEARTAWEFYDELLALEAKQRVESPAGSMRSHSS